MTRVCFFGVGTMELPMAANLVRKGFPVTAYDLNPITPPIGEYIVKSIRQATESKSEAIVIQLDSPGGLDLSMRDNIKECLNATVPVVVYVSPSGARAASAGVLITISAHVAAMAPGTNIGAAHPVAMGIGKADETMMEKVENDAVWADVKAGKLKGFSVEGVFNYARNKPKPSPEEEQMSKIVDILRRVNKTGGA